jgi:tyrosyl-tRNA synthetase
MINQFTGGLEFRRLKKEEKKEDVDEDFSDINADFCPVQSTLSIDEKIKLVKEVGEEIIKEEELRGLFENNEMPICYDGFEPSGRMHIAQGLLRSINVNRLTKAGCIFVFWVADWFAQMNNKLGGDIEKIRKVGRYFVEIWRAAGMDLKNVKFLWCSDEINKRSNDYWQSVINIARANNIDRIKRCCQIMGRNDIMQASQIMYPCMQCTDIFFLKSDITQLGMDQRKVNVLSREYADEVGRKKKPVIVSHHMLKSLVKGVEKMSKSIPDSAIFMEDPPSEVERKIKKAYCPEKDVDDNPIFDYIKFLIFPKFGFFELKRKQEYGGDKTYKTYEEMCEDYKSGALNPADVKPNVARIINEMIEPVRQHFQKDPEARKILQFVVSYKVNR